MAVKLAFGYDEERPYGEWADTEEGRKHRRIQMVFVEKLFNILNQEGAPRTFFILGNFLERCLDDFSKSDLNQIYNPKNPLNDIQQHSYSHRVLRNEHPELSVKLAVSAQEFAEDVRRANGILEEILNVRPIGMRTPRGYHHDLSDIPEIVTYLDKLGFKFVSSDCRSKDSLEAPLTIERQPHSYKNIGYPNIIEIPTHGWQDAVFVKSWVEKQKLLKAPTQEIFPYFDSLFAQAVEMGKDKTLYVTLPFHPWTVMEYDPNLDTTRRLINSAREKGIQIVTYKQIAEDFLY